MAFVDMIIDSLEDFLKPLMAVFAAKSDEEKVIFSLNNSKNDQQAAKNYVTVIVNFAAS